MGLVPNRRSTMTLFSGRGDPGSHQVRLVLAEKGVNVDIIEVTEHNQPEDLVELNPYNTLPTLVDRELVLYEPSIIMEYLDERFPHPPLMPVYPVVRAKSRLMMYRFRQDWYSFIPALEGDDEAAAEAARKALTDSLISAAPAFETTGYFLDDDFSLVDCCLGAFLWRLPAWQITLPEHAASIEQYAERVFARDTFQASLTDVEREIR